LQRRFEPCVVSTVMLSFCHDYDVRSNIDISRLLSDKAKEQ